MAKLITWPQEATGEVVNIASAGQLRALLTLRIIRPKSVEGGRNEWILRNVVCDTKDIFKIYNHYHELVFNDNKYNLSVSYRCYISS